jgi:ABC-type protease/lipase transport system fused ATPase/permease subunit
MEKLLPLYVGLSAVRRFWTTALPLKKAAFSMPLIPLYISLLFTFVTYNGFEFVLKRKNYNGF